MFRAFVLPRQRKRGWSQTTLCAFWRHAGVNRSEIKGEGAIVAILLGCEFPGSPIERQRGNVHIADYVLGRVLEFMG